MARSRPEDGVLEGVSKLSPELYQAWPHLQLEALSTAEFPGTVYAFLLGNKGKVSVGPEQD